MKTSSKVKPYSLMYVKRNNLTFLTVEKFEKFIDFSNRFDEIEKDCVIIFRNQTLVKGEFQWKM